MLFVVNLEQLEGLRIYGNGVPTQTPINNHIALLKNLRKLTIRDMGFEWKEINVLSKLPRLEVLKLKWDSCIGEEWETPEEVRFGQLIFLIIYESDHKHWKASSQNFPKLERLILYGCRKLREIPIDFVDIPKLESIILFGCLPSAVMSAKQIQAGQQEYGNENTIVIEEDTMESDSDESESDEFETIGRPIAEKCKGLPLAIVVVAGLFSKLDTLDEWEKIAKALDSSAAATIAETCSNILLLSYNHLPHHLKACFLYLGVFPEDYEINANELARLWSAEGLVKASENKNFDAVAKSYVQELMGRNLILASKWSCCRRKIKVFRMHDVLHAFCVREAQKENLLHVVRENGPYFLQKYFRWVILGSILCVGYKEKSRSPVVVSIEGTVYLNRQSFDNSDTQQNQNLNWCSK